VTSSFIVLKAAVSNGIDKISLNDKILIKNLTKIWHGIVFT